MGDLFKMAGEYVQKGVHATQAFRPKPARQEGSRAHSSAVGAVTAKIPEGEKKRLQLMREREERQRREIEYAKRESPCRCRRHTDQGHLAPPLPPPIVNDRSGLLLAAGAGDEALVGQLIASAVDLSLQTQHGTTALHRASGRGHSAVVKQLLAAKANVDARNQDGWTPLLKAADNGNPHVVDQLIAAGADVDAKTNSGWSAVYKAADKRHGGVVQRLVDAKADLAVDAVPNLWGPPLLGPRKWGHSVADAIDKLNGSKGWNECKEKTHDAKNFVVKLP